MKSKAYAKKILKFKMQRDWMIALTVTFTFLVLDWFGQIDWNWIWLVSPIWGLLSFYLLCGSVGMTWWFIWGKRERGKKPKTEYGKYFCSCMDAPYPFKCSCGKFK